MNAQTVPLGCQDHTIATLDIDRKDWEIPSGSTSMHSQGFMHNFMLPANTFGVCKKIQNVQVTLTYSGQDLSGMGSCTFGDYYINVYQGCGNPILPASCPTTNIVFEGPIPTLNPVMNFSYGCPSTEFEFGEWFGFDIVPVMAIGSCPEWQSVVSNGQLQLFYDLCVTVTVVDDIIDTPLSLPPTVEVCELPTTLDAGSGYDLYNWNPGGINNQTINATTAGTYSVTVTDTKGCTDEADILVSEFVVAPITINPANPVACNGGTALVSAMGGQTYNWGGGIFGNPVNLPVGNYTLTVTDVNNCTSEETFSVVGGTATINITTNDPNNDDTVCPGDMVQLTANYTPAPGTSILWSTTETTDMINVTSGTYSVTITDMNGCIGSDQVTISNYIPPTVNFNPTMPIACADGTTNVTANGGVSYLWDANAGGSTSPTVNVAPGNYSVTTTDGNGCTGIGNITVASEPLPNPGNNNSISVCNEGSTYDIDLLLGFPHDLTGTWTEIAGSSGLTNLNLNINSTNVSFSGINPGDYLFEYTVIGNPPCLPQTAQINIEVIGQPYAGISATESICSAAAPLNFNTLLSNPDIGGMWDQTSGPSIVNYSDPNFVDFSGLPTGTYVFTYSFTANAICVNGSSSTLTVNIGTGGNAGDPNTIAACEGAMINLFTGVLNGDLGGIFLDAATLTQITNTTINTTGLAGSTLSYLYQVGTPGDPCGFDQQTIDVNVVSSVSAGTTPYSITTPYEACMGEQIDLYSLLDDEDNGGVFTELGSGNIVNNLLNTNLINPNSYQYEYSIGDGMTCPADMTTIHVNIYPTPTVSISALEPSLCNDQCTTLDINFTGEAPFFYVLDVYQGDSTIVNLEVLVSNTSNQQFTICSGQGTGTFSNDTLDLGDVIPSWFLLVSSISDNNNCFDDFSIGGGDTLFMNTAGLTQTFIDSTICREDTILINNTEYHFFNQMGSDTLAGANCDSIVNVQINFYPSDTLRYEDILCSGQSLEVNSTFYDINNPSDTLVFNDENGCDSIVIVDLQFHPPVVNTIDQMLCTGQSIVVNGVIYDASNPMGVEIIANGASTGCDSTINVSLTFGATTTIPVTDLLCPDEFLVYNGIVFDINNPQGVALVIGIGTGCDTLFDIDLSFHDPAINSLTGPFCENFEVTVNGNLYNSTNPIGIEILPNLSSQGCDSIVDINLQFFGPSSSILDDMICSTESIMVNGTTYDITNPMGTELLAAADINGCDSTVNINLQFFVPASSLLEDVLCDNEFVIVNGNVYDITNPMGIEVINASSINGCDSTIFINLSFNPTYNLTEFASICEGESILIGNMMQSTTGIYPFTYTTVNGCDSIVTTNLTVTPCLDPVLTSSIDNICGAGNEGSVTLNINEGETPINISWTGINSGITGNSTINDITDIFNITDLISDSYTIVVTDALNQEIYNQVINIIDLNPILTVDYTIISDIECSDQTASVEITTVGGTAINNYQWNPSNTNSQAIVTDLTSGLYEVTVTDNNNCTDSLSFTLSAPEIISFDLIPTGTTCANISDGSIDILNISGGTAPYMIMVNGSLITGTQAVNLATGNYQVEVIDLNGCTSTANTTISQNANGTFLDYVLEYTVELGDSILVIGTSTETISNYSWASNVSLSCTDCANPVINSTTSQQYTLTATSISGCEESIIISVNVEIPENDIYIPNTFSPNGDGINDNFEIYAEDIAQLTGVEMNIFDRWGNNIFNSDANNGNPSWDGTFKGQTVVSGVYVYVIKVVDLSGEVTVLDGHVTIVQ